MYQDTVQYSKLFGCLFSGVHLFNMLVDSSVTFKQEIKFTVPHLHLDGNDQRLQIALQ